MKFKILAIFLLSAIFVIATGIVIAQNVGLDDQGTPNDPVSNERANACFDGGTMEGKCDTDWEWVCGWYSIRFDSGIIERTGMPLSCGTLLPSLPVVDSGTTPVISAPVNIGCQQLLPNLYINFGTSNFLSDPITYGNPDCLAINGQVFFDFVYTTNGIADASAICLANTGSSTISFSYSANLHQC